MEKGEKQKKEKPWRDIKTLLVFLLTWPLLLWFSYKESKDDFIHEC